MTIFAYDNIITRDTTNLSLNTGDENPSYPLTNIQHVHLTKTYQSVSGTQTIKILIDAAESVNVNAFMIKADEGFGISTISISGNTSDSWGSPPFTDSITNMSDTYNLGYKEFSATQTYRYWLLEVVATGSYVELANVFVGPTAQNLDDQELNQNWTHVNNDTSVTNVSLQGQRYYDERPDIAELEANLRLMNEAETASIDAMYEYAGIRKPIWIIPNIDNDLKYGGQYFFKSRPAWSQERYRLHSTKLSLTEAK